MVCVTQYSMMFVSSSSSAEAALQVAVEVAPGVEAVDDPRGQADRRIVEAGARLRGRVLCTIA